MNKLLLFLLTIIIFASCSTNIVFTDDIRRNFINQGIDIKKVQFYNSKKIVLRKDLNSEGLQVTSGLLMQEKEQASEKIYILKNTPGVCDSINEYYIYISFEKGKNFCFTRNYDDKINQKFKLKTLNKDKNLKIEYNNKKYEIISKSYYTYLNLKKYSFQNSQLRQRVVKGLKIENK